MIADNELTRQIALGEDSVLEFKAIDFSGAQISGPHRDGLADELAAMANTNSGTVLLGIDNRKTVIGIPTDRLDAVEAWIREAIHDLIEPPLLCQIRKILLPTPEGEAAAVIRVDVPKSLFVHRSPGGYLHRVGSSKRQMRPELLARLFQQRSQTRIIRFDEQVVPRAELSDLTEPLWKRFRTQLSAKEDREFLAKLKLIGQDEDGIWRPTVSGILLATAHPEALLENAFVQAVCYRGTERNAAYQLDAKEITGPLDAQIRQACLFVERNSRVTATKSPHRIDTPQFSPAAVFEAVVNAVAHRDYSVYGSKIRLHLFEDRLELFSPGTIPNSMTIDSLSQRQSARNELISSLLAKCPMNVEIPGALRSSLMDKRGEGVPIILTESERISGHRPIYKLLDDAELLLTIRAATLDPYPKPQQW